MKRSLPFVFSASFFGLIFGFTGAAGGFPLYQVSAMSYLIFAGSAQFITLILLIQNETVVAIIIAAIILNLRHLLYGAVLHDILSFKGVKKIIPAYFLTDEAFLTTTMIHRESSDVQEVSYDWVLIGAGFTLWVFWNITTIGGYLLYYVSNKLIKLPDNFVIAASFVGFLVEHFVKYPVDRPVIIITTILAIGMGFVASSSVLLIVVMITGAIIGMVQQWRTQNV